MAISATAGPGGITVEVVYDQCRQRIERARDLYCLTISAQTLALAHDRLGIAHEQCQAAYEVTMSSGGTARVAYARRGYR